MASPEPPPQRKKKSRQPAPTTILALGDDLLREVLLRLPSLPSLVRAALACPAFLRAVLSSPAFRRRFREIHSPSLLSVILVNNEPPLPTFESTSLRRRSDPDQVAAVRGLSVSLTLLPDALGDKKGDGEDAEDEDEEDAEDEEEEDDDVPFWSMCGCHNGYVLLVKPRRNTEKVAVHDLVTRAMHLFPGPPDELFSGESQDTQAEFHLVSPQEDDRSFRVLCISKENGAAQVAVLSSENREWQISPTAGKLKDEGNGTLANGFVCWAIQDRAFIPVLNTATLQFSQIDLPPAMHPYFRTYAKVGETHDGNLCLVHGSDLYLDVWVRRVGNDGVDTWTGGKHVWMVEIDKLGLDITDEYPSLNVVATIGGTIYFTVNQEDPPICWLLSFCLKTKGMKKICPLTCYDSCYPYIMAWPPSFVRNKEEAL